MSVPMIRSEAIEAIGRRILMEYDRTLLDGEPRPIPIETIMETKFDLILEYHALRKNECVLGETIFDDGAAILYDHEQRQYKLIAVKAGTVLIDERLCEPNRLGRLRFTCGHELGHWVLHKKLYSGTGDVAAYDGKSSSDESYGLIERQADALATALLMPMPQIKKCFYRVRPGHSKEQIVAKMADTFEVSKQAMRIRLESRHLL
ncbi:ImmA/IrrE family metallo-endopeptidase [Anaerotruncus colihominis]